jgi:hypothetical protein
MRRYAMYYIMYGAKNKWEIKGTPETILWPVLAVKGPFLKTR